MGNTLALKAAILILFSIYIFVAGFSYTALVVNDEFASIISLYTRVFLLALMLLLIFLKGSLGKIELYFLIFSAFFLITMNPFLIIMAFMILPGIIFADFINNKQAIKITIGASILSFSSIFLLSHFNIIESKVLMDDSEFTLSNLRQTYGFNNPNAASMYIAQILMVSIVYKNKLLSFFIFLFFLWLTFSTGSRTPLYAVVFFIFLIYLSKYNFFLPFIRYGALIFICIIPLIIIFFIANGIWVYSNIDFNHLLTYRLSIAQSLYSEVGGLSLLPSYSSEFVDSGYANILLNGGFLVYLLFFIFSYLYLKIENNRYFFCLFVVFLLILISETFITGNLIFSILLISRSIYLLNKRLPI
ncbi:hypothetical protein [Acinetobacter sp. TWP2-2-3]|jgi:hypothetical protein|uniref:hypothetical protein n=1 Tax=unclassified Acinetobacter TaxID=196816 RepID=UPI003CF39D22